MKTETPTILEACADRDLLNISLSPAQAALLAGVYGLEMPSEECLALYLEATGRESYVPGTPFRDASVLAGRRSGKSTRIAAPLAVYEACIAAHVIPENERGLVEVLAPSQRQARATFRVILRMIERSPKLRGLVENVRTGNEFEVALGNGHDVRVLSSNARTIRGDLVVAAILEEACFFMDTDSGQFNLEEILTAIRPALVTLPDSKCVRVSSPWVASGPMFEDFARRGEFPETLCWKLPSWQMNPSLNSVLLWLEKKRDEQKFAREYGCEFLEAAAQLIPSELIDKAVARGVAYFVPSTAMRAVAALDPSSKGADSFGFALAHKSADGKVVVDWCQQWRPPGGGRFLDYGLVLPEIFDAMNRYGASKGFSDQVCAAALAAEFQKQGFDFEQVSTLGSRAADIYRTVRQLFVAKKVDLPDQPSLVEQLKRLEEKLGKGGKSLVEARAGHDDLAIAACLAIYEASLLPESTEPICQFLPLYDLDDGPASGGLGHPYQPGTGGWRKVS
jgi:hypothetical protein